MSKTPTRDAGRGAETQLARYTTRVSGPASGHPDGDGRVEGGGLIP